MLSFLVAHLFSLLLVLLTARRRTDAAKDALLNKVSI